MAENPEVTNSNEDKELSDLLDSALKDFSSSQDKKDNAKSASSSTKEEEEDENLEGEWNEELIKTLTQCYNSDMMKMFSPGAPSMSEKDIGDAIKQIAGKTKSFSTPRTAPSDTGTLSASGQVFLNQDGGEMFPDFEETISQAVQELTQGLDKSKLNDVMAGGDPNAFFSSFNQNMMQCLLSKEVLHPALKEILDQFPDWLKNNKEKISAEDYRRYETQEKLISQVCGILEKEQDSDSNDVKNKRYEEVLELMIKLQDYGQPPVELVGEVNQVDPKNCVVM
ncbi:peroxisomal biogenesis factor 19 isoform X1 [Coccinella septempunctata]|uniref:peroxisomal biogenesis factor 19 isoform X1 n=1 Tax=Coccinella septempunctata TaxID=41139 RepID=UPI001D06C3C2|nr:peroxisomal biogenesis factor 19 isoform X1 [Coccinella septempunctata]